MIGGKNQERNQICDTEDPIEIQISVSINKVLLEDSHAHWFTQCLQLFCNRTAELRPCDTDGMACRAYLLSGPTQKKVVNPWFRGRTCHFCLRSVWRKWHIYLTFLYPLYLMWLSQQPCVGRDRKLRYHHFPVYSWGNWGSTQSRDLFDIGS